jgi:hypothetical protein
MGSGVTETVPASPAPQDELGSHSCRSRSWQRLSLRWDYRLCLNTHGILQAAPFVSGPEALAFRDPYLLPNSSF